MRPYFWYIFAAMAFLLVLAATVFSPHFWLVDLSIHAVIFLAVLLLCVALRKEAHIPIPASIIVLLSLIIFGDFAGHLFDIYRNKFGPLVYDSWMHTVSSIFMAISFFWIFNFLRKKGRLKMGKFLFWFFIFTSTLSLGALYEIPELLSERYLGIDAIWDEYDSAKDIQCDATGAVLGMIICGATAVAKKKQMKYILEY